MIEASLVQQIFHQEILLGVAVWTVLVGNAADL
jgi:hypothetical protein